MYFLRTPDRMDVSISRALAEQLWDKDYDFLTYFGGTVIVFIAQ